MKSPVIFIAALVAIGSFSYTLRASADVTKAPVDTNAVQSSELDGAIPGHGGGGGGPHPGGPGHGGGGGFPHPGPGGGGGGNHGGGGDHGGGGHHGGGGGGNHGGGGDHGGGGHHGGHWHDHGPWNGHGGHYPWPHWHHPIYPRPVYGWDWDHLRFVTCVAGNDAGESFSVTEDGYYGYAYHDHLAAIEDAALDRCYDETGGDTSCQLLYCEDHY